MQNRLLNMIGLAVGIVLLALGFLFLCAATSIPSRFLLAAVLLGAGTVLVAWAANSLRRIREQDPARVADRVVELVRRRGADEITQADIVGSLGVSNDAAASALTVLAGRQAVVRERREDRDVYVFPQLRQSKVVRKCPYCGSEFSVKTPLQKCPNCGANLEIGKD